MTNQCEPMFGAGKKKLLAGVSCRMSQQHASQAQDLHAINDTELRLRHRW
jgi:hypothetical protein